MPMRSLLTCLAATALLGLAACAPTTGRPSTAGLDRPNLGCLDRAAQIAISIENGSRDSNRLRPCG